MSHIVTREHRVCFHKTKLPVNSHEPEQADIHAKFHVKERSCNNPQEELGLGFLLFVHVLLNSSFSWYVHTHIWGIVTIWRTNMTYILTGKELVPVLYNLPQSMGLMCGNFVFKIIYGP